MYCTATMNRARAYHPEHPRHTPNRFCSSQCANAQHAAVRQIAADPAAVAVQRAFHMCQNFAVQGAAHCDEVLLGAMQHTPALVHRALGAVIQQPPPFPLMPNRTDWLMVRCRSRNCLCTGFCDSPS